MAMTQLAADTIKDRLIEALDPDLYDADALADELVELVDDAEQAAWDRAGRDLRGLIQRDELTTDAVNLVLARHGLSS